MSHRLPKGPLNIPVVLGISGVHVIACLAPFFVDWGAVILFFFLSWLTGWIGITLCYHRLLTHGSFKTYPWFRYVLTIIGTLAWQGGPITWVGNHRIHHKYSDEDGDPHSPTHGFSWAHVLWTLYKFPEGQNPHQYAKDLLRDRGIAFIDRWFWVPQFALLVPIAVGGYLYGGWYSAIAWVVWGFGLRTVFVYHSTWFVNSAAHTWGYQSYKTGDNSRNNWLIGIISGGEGWHNNHHGDQCCARHGRRWWELDPTYWTIVLLEWIGLALDVKKKAKATRPDPHHT